MPPARVYLDNNATTPVLPEVAEAVRAAFGVHGNPSSLHAAGRDAARLLSLCREQVAAWLGCPARSVVFTSGGTEADRLAVLGALAASGGKRHVVASATEHSAVRDLLRALAADRVETTWLAPDASGVIAAASVSGAIRDDTALVAVHWANNETGVIQPVADIAAACRARGVPFLCDAVQAAGKLPLSLGAGAPDLVAVAAHKLHGPCGVGALIVRDGARWRAPFPAGHEGGRRAGTEPLPFIAGFATAARSAESLGDAGRAAVAALRDRLEAALCGALDGVSVNGTGPRVPNTTNLRFPGADGDRLLAMLDRAGIDASGGSACTAHAAEPSHVLLAMGLSPADAKSSLRFSLSRLTTPADIDRAVAAVIESAETARASRRR
ncbi:MAG: Cysteine desulfurase NifS [Planctomycetes bacterium]|nr:Cysteine desulfurase NifS [Planctomycetota bacterium]